MTLPADFLAREAEWYSRSLRRFIRAGLDTDDLADGPWKILEPGRRFVDGWVIDAMCEYLEAVTAGQITQLVINVPPGCMKSLTVSVLWFAWEWTLHAEYRWLCTSYAEPLAMRDNVRARNLIESPWYKERWAFKTVDGKRQPWVQMRADQNAKGRYENVRKGWRMATSVGGGATGERPDRIVVDDPLKIEEAESDVARSGVNDWWDGTMSQRVADQQRSAKVLIMQRLHQTDLSGHLLDKGDWVHLCLPMEYEPGRMVTFPGLQGDRRTEPDELLWPERFPADAVAKQKRDLGSARAAGQLQQRPTPPGGGKLKREWFEIVAVAPAAGPRVRYWDLAATEPRRGKDPDYTVGVKMSESQGIVYIEDIRRDRVSPKGVDDLLKQTAPLDTAKVPQAIEQEGGASGKIAIDHFRREVLRGFTVKEVNPSGSKELRAFPLAAAAEAGNVKLVKGGWNAAFLDECEVFPHGTHDDQVDAASGAYAVLMGTIKDWLSPAGQTTDLPAGARPAMRGIREKEF